MKQKGVIFNADFSPDGKLVLVTTDDNTASLWDVATSKLLGPGMKHDGFIMKAFFISDGKTVLTTSLDSSARFWVETNSKKTGVYAKNMNAFSQPFFNSEVPTKDTVIHSPDGKRIVSIEGAVAQIKNAATGKQIGKDIKYVEDNKNIGQTDISEDIGDGIHAVFSPDGKRILTVPYGDKIARIWDAASGKQVGVDIVHKTLITTFVFSPDGKRVLTASNDKTACIWNAATGRQVGPALKHQREVASAFFSPNGKWILTASYDGTAHLWDPISGKQIGFDMKHEEDNNNTSISDESDDRGVEISAVFSADGKNVITTSKDNNSVRVWNINADSDIPVDLFNLQMKVVLGVELNVETGSVQVIPAVRWQMLKKEYDKKARGHYKTCKYRESNYWSSCYPLEAKKLREN